MKCSHPQIPGLCTRNAFNTLTHGLSRLICKCKGENIECICSLTEQISDPVSEYSCLPRTGTGNDHNGAVAMDNSSSLRFIQFIEKIVFHENIWGEVNKKPVSPVMQSLIKNTILSLGTVNISTLIVFKF